MVFLFASCGDANNTGTTAQNDGADAANAAEDSVSEETTTGKILPDIPAADYGGHEFNIIISLNTVREDVWNDFHAEAESGDVINDAIYRRNIYVEDLYNVDIKDIVFKDDLQKKVKNSVAAADNDYDALLIRGYDACALALEGYLIDLNDMAPLDLTKPWWDQKANRDLMIKDKMFYTTGDISNVVNEATYAILFNKKLVTDYELEDPYALVKNGDWTYDKLIELGSQVSSDLNGDGKYNFDDLYGALVWDDTMMGIVNSIGEKCALINANGEIELTLYSNRVLNIFDKYMAFVLDNTKALMYQREDWSGEKTNALFANNQGLFYLQIMELVIRLRAMEVDFGVLPYPKLEKSQEDYYSTVSSWHSGYVCVSLVQEDLTRTGAILEALAAESMYTLKPAYYDIALKGKYVRDQESEEMLDLIFDSRLYDLGWLYQIGGYNEQIMNLYRNKKTDFTSMYNQYLSKAEQDVVKINTAFGEITN
jgi:hypothetical protein